MKLEKSIKILGINFFNGTAKEAVDVLKSGGLLVVPSAPGLETIKKDSDYYQSLLNADLVIADSGYMVLLWNLLRRQKIKRLSGLEFLNVFLTYPEVSSSSIITVDPSVEEAKINQRYLQDIGFKLNSDDSYIAPWYEKNKVVDSMLLSLIEEKKPKYVVINLGGGVQEKLGAYLKGNLSYKPAIICTGAAIAFLTGQQAKIPVWVDKLFLGWLMRCIEKPKIYVPRYLKSFRLALLILQHGKNSPL